MYYSSNNALVGQLVESAVLEAVKCQFESDQGHQFIVDFCVYLLYNLNMERIMVNTKISYEELTTLVLDKLGVYADDWANTPRSNTTGITYYNLIYNLLQYTIPITAKELGCGYQTVSRTIKKVLYPIFGNLNGGNETWEYVLLNYIKYVRCLSCKEILPYSDFTISKHSSNGLDNFCIKCKRIKNAKSNAIYSISYRNTIIPKWQDLNELRDFYLNTPEGYEVDHIIPLNNPSVCGLHCLTNLQYLTVKENRVKSNKF